MADTKTETTVAEELRTAAAKLREAVAAVPAGRWTLHEDLIEHDGSSESAILTDARDGMDALVLSGEWWGEGLAVMRLLVALHAAAEPFASWLDTEAHMWEQRGNSSEGHTFHALAVARAINGGDRG